MDIQQFITNCEGYFEFFLTIMASTRNKVLFAVGLMKGTAAYWFEPIKRDYLREENEADRDERTNRIFRDWDNMEVVLREAVKGYCSEYAVVV
jgi:hypothetical protein